MDDLKSISAVEVFAAGVWNGETYTVEDLDKMVSAFEETGHKFKPFLKLGHDDKQKLLQKDGYPAAGWINKVYRVGNKLMADFSDIPSKIYDLIVKKAYRKVSSEIYWNIVIDDKKYPYLLGAVALLGANTPAVTNLNDILGMYTKLGPDDGVNFLKVFAELEKNNTVKVYDFENNDFIGDKMSKTEKEIQLETKLQELEKQLDAVKLEKKEFSLASEKVAKEIEALKTEKEELEKKAYALEQNQIKIKNEAFVDSLVSEKLVTIACKPYVLSLLSDKKEYTFKTDAGEKKLDKEGLIKEIFSLNKIKDEVNLEENSSVDVTTEKSGELETKIGEYMAKNKVSYGMAYRAVIRETAQ